MSLVGATLAAAVFAVASIAAAQDNSAATGDNASAGANSSGSSGQTLEIPPAAPTPSPGSTWSDGTNTYTWQDESSENSGGQGSPDLSLPQPSYAGVDAYMNQQIEAETAMGPAFSPMFGSPMPFYPDPYFGYGAPIYGYGYGLPPPVVVVPNPPPPPPPPPPPHHRRGPGFTFHFHPH